jgi:hypothetical protein
MTLGLESSAPVWLFTDAKQFFMLNATCAAK